MREPEAEAASFLTRRRLLKLAGAGVLACGGGGAYATLVEPLWLRTIELDVALPGVAPAFDGFTIVQLSDFHCGAGVPYDLFEDAVARANAARPDLIALTGDFVHNGGNLSLAADIASILKALEAREGVVGVLGNHDADVYSGGGVPEPSAMRRVRQALDRTGRIRILSNERLTLRRGDARLHVAGFGDLWSKVYRPERVPMRDDGAPTVALCHNPDAAHDLAGRGARLILSGHTHGGQVSLPFLGPPILPIANREFDAGLFDLGGCRLYVNRGVGWLTRVRLFVRPEVTILRLRPAAA